MDSFSLKLRCSSEKDINWGIFVPEIAFVLYLCNAIKEYVDFEEIDSKAARTYPDSFSFMGGPDTYTTIMTLKEAKSANWRYVRGNLIKRMETDEARC